MKPALDVDLSNLEFENTGEAGRDKAGRLLATIRLFGRYHHLEAIAVTTNAGGEQCAADPTFESLLGELHEAFGPDGAFQTVEINGREYVLFVSPYSL